MELDLVDTDWRPSLLLTWCHLGAPPYFHIPLSPRCLYQGRAVLTILRPCHGPQNWKTALYVISNWTEDTRLPLGYIILHFISVFDRVIYAFISETVLHKLFENIFMKINCTCDIEMRDKNSISCVKSWTLVEGNSSICVIIYFGKTKKYILM